MTNNMYQNILKETNLSDNEITLYTLLLTSGEHTATQIATKTGFKRGNTYYLLDALKEKGLVEQFKQEKKTFFRITHPQHLYAYIEKQEKALEQAKQSINTVLPTLISEYNLSYEKPGVYFFEGKEGLQKVFQDIYAPDKPEVIGCVELEKIDEVFPNLLQEKLIPKRVHGKLRSIAFISDSEQARKLTTKDAEQNRESILVDKKEYPLPAEIDIYKDRVAMLSFKRGKFMGVVIENEDIATTLRSIFTLARDRSKTQNS